jgi:hypothetical protein
MTMFQAKLFTKLGQAEKGWVALLAHTTCSNFDRSYSIVLSIRALGF